MVLLTCNCLNVKISLQCTDHEFKQLQEQNLRDQEDYIPTGFFPKGELEVETDAKGIKQEHGYLVHRRKLGNYMVFRCLNCGLDTYAMHMNGHPLIVNNLLQSDPVLIERLFNSADFSKVFQIILTNKDTEFTNTMPDPKSSSYQHVQSTLNSIQKQLADFIIQEEAEMETRIRMYEEAQKEDFQSLQVRLKEQKKRMISLLISTAPVDRDMQEEEDSSQRDSTKRSTVSKKLPAKKKTLGRVQSLPPALEQESDDPMFGFDGLETSEQTFYRDTSSSEDEADDKDDVFEERSAMQGGPKPRLTYSTSVPISVPSWNMAQKHEHLDNDDEDLIPADPNQIAASMQALAQSITDDNRYIFGDRPRPRLNTGDFNR